MNVQVKEAVILAAGLGSRMHATDIPKPLMMLGGKRIIEYPINSLFRAGITRFVVVTGFRADVLQKGLRDIRWPKGSEVVTVYNDQWKEPNGISLAVAEQAVKGERFVLSMSDHVYDYHVVLGLIQDGITHGVKLCVDRNIDGVFDLDDATRVLVRQGKIVDIGKNIDDYNAIDMGVFLCTHDIFPALRQAFSQGKKSLSDGMRVLGKQGYFTAFDATGLYWQDVDDPAMFEKAARDIKRLGIF